MVRALIERYWAAQDPDDPATLGRLRHPTWSAEWPQSGERIPSHAADVAIHEAYEGYPGHRLDRLEGSDELWRPMLSTIAAVPVRISGASDIWIAEASLEYPTDGVWRVVMIVELTGGLIGRETAWFGRTADAAPWPATFTGSIELPRPAAAASMEPDAAAESRHVASYAAYLARISTDPDASVRTLFRADAILDRPQYGQRAGGLDAIALLHREQPWLMPDRTRRVLACGDVLVVESRLDGGADGWFCVRIIERTGDQVAHVSEYLAEPVEPPVARRPWMEPLEEAG